MIEVFKTDVTCPVIASEIVDAISSHVATIEVNFDLEDCDHIFRIRTTNIDADLPILIIKQFEIMGHSAAVLDDKPLQAISPKVFVPVHEKRGINVFLSFI